MDLNRINNTANLSRNNSMSLMVFKMAPLASHEEGHQPFFAINIFKVREVLNAQEYALKSMPSGDNYMLGMIDVRGEHVPVYNLARWLGYAEVSCERSVYISSEMNGRTVAFHVSHIFGVEEKNWEHIIPAKKNDEKIVSQTRIGEELCLIIDAERMLNEILGTDFVKEAEVSPLNISPKHQHKWILYADDQRSIREYMSAVLTNLGVKSKGFVDGQGLLEAVKTMPKEDIGVVITDLEMPNVSGHTVIRMIKENPKYRSIPVVIHTSMTVGDSQRQAQELGANHFIGKIDTDTMVSIVNRYMA